MRRFHLMIALFGLAAFSVPANAKPIPNFSGPKPSFSAPKPSFSAPKPSYSMPNYNHSVPSHYPQHTSPPVVKPYPSVTNTTHPYQHNSSNGTGKGSTTVTNKPSKTQGLTSQNSSNLAKTKRPGQDKLLASIAGLIDSVSGAIGSGGSDGGGSDEGGTIGSGGSFGDGYSGGEEPNGGVVESTPAEVETPSEWGMKVTMVAANGAAAKADLRVDDIIVAVAGKRVQSFEELTDALDGVSKPIDIVIINGENNKLEKMKIVPRNGKIGIATDPVVLE